MNAEQRINEIIQNNGLNDISYEKMTYSRSTGMYGLYLVCNKCVDRNRKMELTALFKKELDAVKGRLRMIIRQPAGDLENDDGAFAEELKNFMIETEPALLPFIKGCSVKREDKNIDITFNRELGPDLIRATGLPQKIENYFKLTFCMDVHVRELSCDVCVECEEYTPTEETVVKREESVKTAAPLPPRPQKKEAKPAAPEAPKAAKPADPDVVLGKNFRDEITPMTQITELGVTLAAEGEVVSSEIKLVKDGKFTILLFGITDFSTTISCKAFLRGDQSEALSGVKAGKYFRIRGKLEEDKFAKNRDGSPMQIFTVTDIVKAKKAVRLDTCEEKRVELHLHTNMSSMDAIPSAKAYISQAAAWGHKAIAITDHGVVQAFPEAAGAAKANGIKVIFGMEAYMFDDMTPLYSGRPLMFRDRYVVFDIETTGFDFDSCALTEIGAVRVEDGKIIDTFGMFVNPGHPIPEEVVEVTHITDDMVKDAPPEKEALKTFFDWLGDDVVGAHNGNRFDFGFIKTKCKKYGYRFDNDTFDTLAVARVHLPEMRTHKLDKLALHYGITFEHHRAVNDAECTAKILFKIFGEMEEQGITTFGGMNALATTDVIEKTAHPVHTILLAQNKTGLVNLYKLISIGHLDYFKRRPRVPMSAIAAHREGLLVGSACCEGELYESIIYGADDAKTEKIAEFYDYLEIQPIGNNAFLTRERKLSGEQKLREVNQYIYDLAKKQNKPIVAACDCHFMEPKDECFRRIIMDSIGFKDVDEQPPLYFRTTDEMLEEFSYLGEEAAYDAVIRYPNEIAESVEHIDLFPGETQMPIIENAADDIRRIAYENMKERYGDPLPDHIEARLEKELGSIIGHGFSVLYWIAMKLVKKSNSDGYLVGSRGSVGSSLAAFATDITEVNPLPPHYRCPNCKHSDFNIDTEKYACGVDMPPAKCPVCGADYESDGYDIPFEVFLGFNADKVPDIDLNFSGEYQPNAHRYIIELFGEKYVYRAGTISAVQEKTAEGFVRKYLEKRNMTMPQAEITRLALGCTGVKRTTGQHPGGLVIVPKNRDVHEFTAINKPANDVNADSITTHFDFNSMHDILVKLDILGHDNPTMIRELQDGIGFDPLTIPLNDPETFSLFTSTDALGIKPEQIRGIKVGTLGIPEFGTHFVRGLLLETKPKSMADLVRISGLSHGTNVWQGNASELVNGGICTISEVICTRDDIMNGLIRRGVEKKMSFDVMESVRKGKWAGHKEKRQAEMEEAMYAANVEEWFIESCRKIGYMFPKAHAVAYVIMSLRIAYCKVHYPLYYYSSYFTVRGGDFDVQAVLGGTEGILVRMKEIEDKGFEKSATEAGVLTNLEIALEMCARGFRFLPVDLKKSQAKRFVVEGDGLRLPFIAIPKLGEKVAENLERVMKEQDIRSIDELKSAAKLSGTVIDMMRDMGCFKGMSESAQMTFFEVM